MVWVSCPPGLEALLESELEELGAKERAIGHRGVEIEEDLELIYRVLYASRLAARVVLPIRTFKCDGKKSLYEGALGIDWSPYLTPDQTLAIDVHGKHPEFRNTLFAAQVVKDAICDQLRERHGKRPSVQPRDPDLQVHLVLERGRATLSIDLAGAPLHKRGYRRKSVPAPLQENLAAAMVHLAGYEGKERLCDPCCGSGTLLIEAAMKASCTPSGYYRTKWAITRLPLHDEALWQRVRSELNAKRRPLEKGSIVGIDQSSEAIAAARTNVSAAGFGKQIELIASPFQKVEGVAAQLILSNPPLGKRLEGEEELYRDLGHFLRHQSARPAKALLLVGSRKLGGCLRLPADKRIPFEASGLRATLHIISLREKK